MIGINSLYIKLPYKCVILRQRDTDVEPIIQDNKVAISEHFGRFYCADWQLGDLLRGFKSDFKHFKNEIICENNFVSQNPISSYHITVIYEQRDSLLQFRCLYQPYGGSII